MTQLRQCRTFISSNCTCDEEITLQSTLVMHVYFSTGMTYSEEGKGGWEIEKPTTTEQKCPCTSTNKKRSETRKGNCSRNLSISKKKERKKETVRQGKAGEQSEKCQEKANGPLASNQALPALLSTRHVAIDDDCSAVVVNSNMSRGKYLAREGPGSRLTVRPRGTLSRLALRRDRTSPW